MDEFNEFYESIKDYVKFKSIKKSTGSKLKDQIIVFTGFRDKELKEMVIEMGGQVKTGVSGNTTMVVCKDNETKNGDSSKIKDARKKKIKIVTKDELLKMIK